jgi:hypothetical protein
MARASAAWEKNWVTSRELSSHNQQEYAGAEVFHPGMRVLLCRNLSGAARCRALRFLLLRKVSNCAPAVGVHGTQFVSTERIHVTVHCVEVMPPHARAGCVRGARDDIRRQPFLPASRWDCARREGWHEWS